MSNYLALASVTAAFGRIVAEALERVPEPSGIPHVRFGAPQIDPQFIGCTLFAYRVSVNAYNRNADLVTRTGSGELVARPMLPIDIEYVLTFHGDEPSLEPQRFAGSVMSAVHARPQLSVAEIVRMTSSIPYLRGSDLGTGFDRVNIVPTDLDHYAMVQIWGTFPQVPYRFSIAYTATSVVLESDLTPRTLPTVKEVTFDGPGAPG